MVNLPVHISRLRVVTMDQAALVMAGLAHEVSCVEEAIVGNYIGWIAAKSYKETIAQAVNLKEIMPMRAYTHAPEHYNLKPDELMLVGNDEINFYTRIIHAEFLATEIWPWVEREMSSDSPWYSSNLKDSSVCGKPEVPNNMAWGDFAGKDTALMLISGMAVALEKSGGKYFRGGKLNKSAVAQSAIDAINEYGHGTTLTPKALTNLLVSALEVHTDKLEDK